MSNYKRHYEFGNIVFITMITDNRIPILTDNIDLIKESLKSVKYKFEIVAGVILQDHIHLLLKPQNMKDIPYIV